MSYEIKFKVKIEGVDKWVQVCYPVANITSNVRGMIQAATGLKWHNGTNNGLCGDVMPKIANGLYELRFKPSLYKQYESPNGWGTVEGTKRFFEQILQSWEGYVEEYGEDVAAVTTFWVE